MLSLLFGSSNAVIMRHDTFPSPSGSLNVAYVTQLIWGFVLHMTSLVIKGKTEILQRLPVFSCVSWTGRQYASTQLLYLPFYFLFCCCLWAESVTFHFCAAIIISGRGCSISTTGVLIKIQDPPVREFQETLSLHQINEVSEPHGYVDSFTNDQVYPGNQDTKRQEVII